MQVLISYTQYFWKYFLVRSEFKIVSVIFQHSSKCYNTGAVFCTLNTHDETRKLHFILDVPRLLSTKRHQSTKAVHLTTKQKSISVIFIQHLFIYKIIQQSIIVIIVVNNCLSSSYVPYSTISIKIISERSSMKRRSQYKSLFRNFDSPTLINPIVSNLPTSLQERWTVEATKYKKRESVIYPPFTFFIDLLKNITRMKNNPSFKSSRSDGEKPLENHSRNFCNTVVGARTTETLSSPNNVSIVNTLTYIDVPFPSLFIH